MFNFRQFLSAALKRKKLKTQNFALLSSFRGIKYMQSLKALDAVVLKIDRVEQFLR